MLDPGRADAVDAHDPPGWMRELVVLRDRHCVFPGCTIDARACDLDHLHPYVPLEQGGPPGQTSPANLACLCRRHHRAKTFAGWRYRRLPDPPDDPDDTGDGNPGPTYEWTSPTLRTYRVSHPTRWLRCPSPHGARASKPRPATAVVTTAPAGAGLASRGSQARTSTNAVGSQARTTTGDVCCSHLGSGVDPQGLRSSPRRSPTSASDEGCLRHRGAGPDRSRR